MMGLQKEQTMVLRMAYKLENLMVRMMDLLKERSTVLRRESLMD